MRNDKPNLIVDKTFQYALKVLDYAEKLYAIKRFALADQIIRSGTSIGANVWEAQNAESKADFIHKMKIAAKEGDEQKFWMYLMRFSQHYPDPAEMVSDIEEIERILSAILSSSKKHK
ncbi:MAG: four helix bundle protein [Chitinophagaceae bacterium]|nr:four helix bundle protein [Chitinophagaceae bacterium]